MKFRFIAPFSFMSLVSILCRVNYSDAVLYDRTLTSWMSLVVSVDIKSVLSTLQMYLLSTWPPCWV